MFETPAGIVSGRKIGLSERMRRKEKKKNKET
jgi:hypothetical protein